LGVTRHGGAAHADDARRRAERLRRGRADPGRAGGRQDGHRGDRGGRRAARVVHELRARGRPAGRGRGHRRERRLARQRGDRRRDRRADRTRRHGGGGERMKPVRGLTLGNRYRLVRRIAVGGMGEVWVAADDALGREVAVKVLRSEYAGNEDFLNRLRTEARNSAALSHPNIAQMYDYGEANGSGYLVMELVVGEPMADLLEREPVLPAVRLLPILAQTARGLHAAHLSGVVHRDVKPGNILIDRAGTVKITDFGVSLAANQVPMTATGMVMGTAQYLSPEQAVGQAATGASDIYALGIVAYESIAGNRPFTGSTPVDIAVAHVNEPVPPLPSSGDPALAELVMAMLAKDPPARPPPADALARVFEEIGARLASDPWSARSKAPAPTPRRARRARTAEEAPAPEPDPAPVIT